MFESEIKIAEEDVKKMRNETRAFDVLREYNKSDRVVHIKEIVEELKKRRTQGPLVRGPFPKLSEFTGGFHAGQLIVISGPTGHGKTSLAKTFTAQFINEGERSVWFSYEMPPIELTERFPGEVNFYIPRELASGRLDWIEQRIAESLVKFRTSIVFIDHLHFLIDLQALAISKNQSILIGILLRQLKSIAIKYGILIFLMAHIRKLNLEEEVPGIDDLRDSSFVGQEADSVLLIWRKSKLRTKREAKDGVPQEWTNESHIALVKNRRTGALGEFDVMYEHRTNAFTEIDRIRGGDDGGNSGFA